MTNRRKISELMESGALVPNGPAFELLIEWKEELAALKAERDRLSTALMRWPLYQAHVQFHHGAVNCPGCKTELDFIRDALKVSP